MSATTKLFTANVPQFAEDVSNGQLYLVADMVVVATACINTDGSLKGVDIEGLFWKNTDVTKYVYECQSDTWDRLKGQAKDYYLNAHVTQ